MGRLSLERGLWSLAIALWAGCGGDAERCARGAARVTEGPLLGAVSADSIKIWVRGDRAAEVVVRYGPARQADLGEAIRGEFSSARHHTAVLPLAGLRSSTTYRYRVETEGCEPGSEHTFTTLPPEGEPARIRFATAGDVGGGDVPGFAEIAAVQPDFVLMVGDNVYADGLGKAAEAYRERYLEVFRGEQFAALFAEVPAFAIWDDHELVNDYWAGKNEAVYAFASRLYDDFQGSRNPDPLAPGQRYYTFRAADVGFFVLDTRTHRSRNRDPDGPDKTMLGEAQKAALLEWLETDTSRVHVLVSSVLMSGFTTTGLDSWSAFQTELSEILDTVAAARPANLIVVSGDQHWSAIMRLTAEGLLPYTIYEFQATPLAFAERGAPEVASDALLALDNGHRVFGVFDVDTTVDPPELQYTLCAVGEPCEPHAEPHPVSPEGDTLVPYSVRFEGSGGGFRWLDD